MATGFFLTVITAMIGTFIGIGIADSEWLKKEYLPAFYVILSD